MGMPSISCTKAPKIVALVPNISAMNSFPQQGLKNFRISLSLLVLSSPSACSLQNPPIVTSLAAETNLATVISLPSASSSCFSRKLQTCFTRGGCFLPRLIRGVLQPWCQKWPPAILLRQTICHRL